MQTGIGDAQQEAMVQALQQEAAALQGGMALCQLAATAQV